MIFKDYIKERKYILFFWSFAVILFIIVFKKKSDNTGDFEKKLSVFLADYNIKPVDTQKINCRYSLKKRRFFFTGIKNGLTDVFSINLRVNDKCEIIETDKPEKFTDTPMSEEVYIKSNNDFFSFLNEYQNKKVINIIKNNIILRILLFDNVKNYKLNSDFLYVNGIKYYFNSLKDTGYFSFYKEKEIKNNHIKGFENDLRKYIRLTNNKKFRYTIKSGISTDIPFEYFKLKIPKKNEFEIFFFDKSKFFLKGILSGGIKYSKTGLFFKSKKYKKAVYFGVRLKGGFKSKEITVRPIINNYPSIKINGKNKIGYGILKENLSDNTVLQFDYPLIFKGNTEVEIKNMKINLSKEAQKDKVRTGICLKDNYLGFFNFKGKRNLLMDYLYLIDCDFAVETYSDFIGEKILSEKDAVMALVLKKNDLNFKKFKYLELYEDKDIRIYKISCGDLKLAYMHGGNDPLSYKKITYKPKKDDITVNSGGIDPINPDAIFSEGAVYYKGENERYKFILSKEDCIISNEKIMDLENIEFYKEGKILYNKNLAFEIKEDKYKKIYSAIALSDDFVYIYEFKKSHSPENLLKYNKIVKPRKIIVFENYGNESGMGKLIIGKNNLNDEIFMIK